MISLAGACVPASPPASSEPSGQGGATQSGTGGRAPGESPGTGGAGGAPATGTGGATGTTGAGGTGGGSSATGTGGSPPTPPDAGAGTGGSGDAPAAADTPAQSTPGGSCTAKFCDDFEGAPAGGPPGGNWMLNLSKGTLAVDETKAFSGARSVKLTHQGAPAKMFMELRQPVLPLSGTVVYGRLMYQLTKSPTGQYTHFEIVRGGGPLPGGGRAQLNTGAENGKVVINYEPGDCTKYSKVPFPEKRWTCYQWRFDLAKNDVHEWVDNMSADDIPVAPAGTCWKSPMVLDALHIGWQSYHGAQPVELWIDDVAVGTEPIPCPTGAPTKP